MDSCRTEVWSWWRWQIGGSIWTRLVRYACSRCSSSTYCWGRPSRPFWASPCCVRSWTAQYWWTIPRRQTALLRVQLEKCVCWLSSTRATEMAGLTGENSTERATAESHHLLPDWPKQLIKIILLGVCNSSGALVFSWWTARNLCKEKKGRHSGRAAARNLIAHGCTFPASCSKHYHTLAGLSNLGIIILLTRYASRTYLHMGIELLQWAAWVRGCEGWGRLSEASCSDWSRIDEESPWPAQREHTSLPGKYLPR